MLCLTALETLGFHANGFTKLDATIFISLPAWIGELTALEDLYAGKNRIAELPASITRLDKLKRLDVADNHIAALPQDIGRLSGLRDLNLAGNRLTTLPKSFCEVATLSDLTLADNPCLGPAGPNCVAARWPAHDGRSPDPPQEFT